MAFLISPLAYPLSDTSKTSVKKESVLSPVRLRGEEEFQEREALKE